MFFNCSSLKYLPDISKWKTNNVINMEDIFNYCNSLESLPDISKWNTNNITYMNYLFYYCKSLEFFPDISKWKINKSINFYGVYIGCNCFYSYNNPSKNFK